MRRKPNDASHLIVSLKVSDGLSGVYIRRKLLSVMFTQILLTSVYPGKREKTLTAFDWKM